MSFKAHRGSHPEASFDSLPEAVIAHIAYLSKLPRRSRGHPLLRVSRSCRDAVLSSCATIRMYARCQSSTPAPDARLLHRACCQARPGLALWIHLMRFTGSLAELLQPGIECGGWRNVHKLEVFHASLSAHLLVPAFPALTKLELNGVELGDGTLFSMLAAQAACPLSSITLHMCTIHDAAVEVAAAALAQLPSLTACHVQQGSVPLRIASQLTGLTHLEGEQEAGVPPPDTQLVKAVFRNKGLQSLTVTYTCMEWLSAEMLQHLLMGCSNLAQLDLSQDISDDGLDILLQHGTNITDLALSAVHTTRSWADSTCRWRSLRLRNISKAVAALAYLPLRSVQELGTGGEDGTLHLPLLPAPQLDLLLQRAASNLAACPAWQKQPATRILLYAHPRCATAEPGIEVAQLLSALSPLGGPHLQHLGISINADWGQQEVQVLARSSLRSLSLRRGIVKPSFWPALSQHLPHLKELGLMHKVEVNMTDITAFLRKLTQPFTLYMGPDVVADHSVADLADSIGAWQLQGVSVKQEYPADEYDFGEVDEAEEELQEEEQEEASSEGDEEAEVVDAE